MTEDETVSGDGSPQGDTDDRPPESNTRERVTESGETDGPQGGDPSDTSTEPALTPDEAPRSLDRRVRLKWAGEVFLFVGVIAVAGGVAAVVSDRVAPWMVAVVGLPLLAVGLLWVRVRYRRWAFQFREDHLFLERGVYRQVETVVPYVRIQHVDTSRRPVERALGLSTLVVYTAGSRGADVSIPGLPAVDAEAMQDRVKRLAIEAEGGEGL